MVGGRRCRTRGPVECVGALLVSALFAGAALPAIGGGQPASTADDQLQDGELPKFLTAEEAAYVTRHPLALLRSSTPPPTGPLRTPAEYEPMAGVLLSYRGSASTKFILDQMAKHITTTGDADVIAIVPFQSNYNESIANMTAAGADMSRVTVLVQPTNSVWIRDFGPRYVYEGNVRVVVDHTYNRPRPLDDAIPAFLADHFNHGYYLKPLVHGGGNFHLDALSPIAGGYTTRLINNENPGLTEQDIYDIWFDYKNLSTTFYDVFPSYVDATGHIDMWMQVVSDDTIVISEWPADPGSIQAQICDFAAADFALRGFTVVRTPARVVSGTHYTYTNVVVVNDLIIIPSFTNSNVLPYNAIALSRWQQAAPDKTIVVLNGQPLVTSAGVFHCVMMHVPAHLGGENPTAYLRNLRGGEQLEPYSIVTIEWLSDGITQVNRADLVLSTDGGGNFDFEIASDIPNSGTFEWTVPAMDTSEARLRVVVRDRNGNSGFDESDSNLTIGDPTPGVFGDLNGDGVVNVFDLLIVLASWGPCDDAPAKCPTDLNGDGMVNIFDLLILLSVWGT